MVFRKTKLDVIEFYIFLFISILVSENTEFSIPVNIYAIDGNGTVRLNKLNNTT